MAFISLQIIFRKIKGMKKVIKASAKKADSKKSVSKSKKKKEFVNPDERPGFGLLLSKTLAKAFQKHLKKDRSGSAK